MTPSPSASTPIIPSIEPSNIPTLLKQEKRWLCWKAGPLKSGGKFGKITIDPISGRNINGRDQAHWLTFASAMDALRHGIAHGIGFALSTQRPILVDSTSYYVTVLDFDDCLMRMSEIEALWLGLGKPFAEMSPSMRGIHMWGLCREALTGGNAGNGRELYSDGRFVTMTGISAKGTFGACQALAKVQQAWFSQQTVTLARPITIERQDMPSNLAFASSSDNWFDRLLPDDRNACLSEILRVPAIVALADTSDSAPSPNWRTVLAACARSSAPNARDLCRAWAQSSARFDAENFDLRWRSYRGG